MVYREYLKLSKQLVSWGIVVCFSDSSYGLLLHFKYFVKVFLGSAAINGEAIE